MTQVQSTTVVQPQTPEQMLARIAELEAIKAKLEASPFNGQLNFKVGEKGGVCVMGLGHFPVTLYYEQWLRLFDAVPRLREFMETNKAKLSMKAKKQAS